MTSRMEKRRMRLAARLSKSSAHAPRPLVQPLESRTLLSAGISASAQLHLLSTGGTAVRPVYNYDVTLTDTGTTNIGTFWLSWIPGEDLLPSVPLSESSPAGWGDATGKPFITGSGNSFDGTGLQWIVQAPASALTPGKSLGGFDFSSLDSPTLLAGMSPTHTTTPALESFVYITQPFGDLGFQFTVATAPTPVPATKLAVGAPQPLVGVAGKALAPTLAVDVETAAGAIDTSNTSSVTLSIVSGPPGGKLAGTFAVPAIKGVATFSTLKFTVAGAYTLKATDGLLTAVVSKPITISAAAASKLVFTTQPTTGIAGKTLAPATVVKIEDAFGNVVIGNTSTVTLARLTGPTGGAVAGTLSAKAVKGVATFSNLSMKIAGAYALKATDGALAGATAKPITIGAAAAAKLVITQQPTTGKVGIALTPALIVKVEDLFGNVVITNSSIITLAINSALPLSGGTLAGTKSIAAIKGVATFAHLSFTKAATYTLKATDGLLSAAVSKSIIIT